MESVVIRLKENEVISINQNNVGYTVTGPALVVVIKEKAVAGTTAHPYGDSDNGMSSVRGEGVSKPNSSQVVK